MNRTLYITNCNWTSQSSIKYELARNPNSEVKDYIYGLWWSSQCIHGSLMTLQAKYNDIWSLMQWTPILYYWLYPDSVSLSSIATDHVGQAHSSGWEGSNSQIELNPCSISEKFTCNNIRVYVCVSISMFMKHA